MKVRLIASLLLAAVCPAATISVYPSSSQWISPAGENTGGGSTAITNNQARSGDGAAELHGDRTRFFTGYGNFGKLSDLTELSFEWMVPAYSISALSADYTPALRLTIFDSGRFSDLVWEGAYNNIQVARDVWNTADLMTANLWQRINSANTSKGGAMTAEPLAQWLTDPGPFDNPHVGYTTDAYVAAVWLAVGSSAGRNYVTFADNVTVGFAGQSRTYNFEPAPEPSTYLLFGGGFLALRILRTRKPRKS